MDADQCPPPSNPLKKYKYNVIINFPPPSLRRLFRHNEKTEQGGNLQIDFAFRLYKYEQNAPSTLCGQLR